MMLNDPSRPALRIGSAARMAEWLRQEIGRGLLAGYFERRGDIIFTSALGEQGYTEPRDDRWHNGPATVSPLKGGGVLTAHAEFAYDCFKMEKQGEGKPERKVQASFPDKAGKRVFDAPAHMLPNLRTLAGVTHTPIVRKDGTILDTPGYDDASGYLFLPEPGVTYRPVSPEPTPDEVQVALALIDYMLEGFVWETPSDRINYLGLLLTPLLRLLTPPPYKLFPITAHQPGSGKSLLAEVVKAIHGSVWRVGFPETEEEFKKWGLSVLIGTTAPVVVADNVSGVLAMAALDGMLTSGVLADRLLSTNTTSEVPNDRVWVITGNNVSLGADLARRTVLVRINPDVPDPQNRTGFAIEDLKGWVASRRADLIHALLTLVASWNAQGQPMEVRKQSDGFARWESAVGGILAAAGVEGQFDAEETRPVASDADADWGSFLAFLHSKLGDEPWKVRDVAPRFGWSANTDDEFDDVARNAPYGVRAGEWDANHLPSDDLRNEALRGAGLGSRKLGKWLGNRNGRWAGGFKVLRYGESEKVALWVVQKRP
jgi:hypothetical protein